MGGSSKGSSQQTTQNSTSTSAPPSWAKPLYTQGAADALNLYNSGQGGNVYQGQRVADLSGQTQSAASGLQDVANNYNNSYLNGLATNPTSSSSNLSNMANGSMIGNNTAFTQGLQNTLNNAATTINSQMSGAGRYGSGAHTGVMSNTLGQAATSAYANQYNQDVQNMMNANNQIDSANQSQLAGANNYYQGQSGAQKNALIGGQILDANAQSKLDAEREKWEDTDNQGWDRLGLLQSAANGFSGNYGTTSSVGTARKSSGSGIGQSIAGGLGSVLGLSGKSDIRAKENIVPIGEKNGYPLYEFNYIGDGQRYRGVMAQDVLLKNPDAVFIDEADGMYAVEYSKLGFSMEKVG